jgi:hypothetical protein
MDPADFKNISAEAKENALKREKDLIRYTLERAHSRRGNLQLEITEIDELIVQAETGSWAAINEMRKKFGLRPIWESCD